MPDAGSGRGCSVALGLVMPAYETVGVAKFGRTLGMAWLHIRPVRVDGAPLGWGRALARAVIFSVAGFLGWIGLLDPLWCLWDDRRQCLHDKVADSIMINDPADAAPDRR
ncbi:MAG: RDD family protein [Acidimicrobiales bacterium]